MKWILDGILHKYTQKMGIFKGDLTPLFRVLLKVGNLIEMGGNVSRKKVGDMGINGRLPKTLWHEKAGIQVKQSDRVGRNVIDNFETALRRGKYQKGYIVDFSFTKGAYEEVARLKNKGVLDIKLITVDELLNKRKTLLE